MGLAVGNSNLDLDEHRKGVAWGLAPGKPWGHGEVGRWVGGKGIGMIVRKIDRMGLAEVVGTGLADIGAQDKGWVVPSGLGAVALGY